MSERQRAAARQVGLANRGQPRHYPTRAAGPRSAEARKATSAALAGVSKSPAARQAMRQAALVRIERDGPPRPMWKNTALEARLWKFLVEAGYTIEIEKPFGRYRVDVYLPDYHLAFEADGWHHAQYQVEHDLKRDAWLWETQQLPVVRLNYLEIEGWEFPEELVLRKRKEEIHRWVEEACR